MNDWGHYHASGYSYNDPIVAIVLDTQTRAKNGGMYVLLPLTLWVLSSHNLTGGCMTATLIT